MSVIDELLAHNRAYVSAHGQLVMATAPRRALAVLTCMDSRLDLFGALGLELGDAHLVRNAGGLATDDALRSLMISQRLLGTRSVMVVHHTRCGLEGLDESRVLDDVAAATGDRPGFTLGAFVDVNQDVRDTLGALRASSFLDSTDIRGFVFDVDDGSLREVI